MYAKREPSMRVITYYSICFFHETYKLPRPVPCRDRQRLACMAVFLLLFFVTLTHYKKCIFIISRFDSMVLIKTRPSLTLSKSKFSFTSYFVQLLRLPHLSFLLFYFCLWRLSFSFLFKIAIPTRRNHLKHEKVLNLNAPGRAYPSFREWQP